MNKGDLVLVPFPFTDLSGSKTRPALVLVDQPRDATVAFISTQLAKAEIHGVSLSPTKENGLKKASIIKLSKIATLEKKLFLGRLGKVSRSKQREIDQNLIQIFQITT